MAETNFFWDPLSDNVLQEREETSAVSAEYTIEPRLYGYVISQNRGGAESQLHFDAQGSTIAATDGGQNVTDTFSYAAFGEVAERGGTTEVQFEYNGQSGYYLDGLTSHYLVRRRVYGPQRERWLAVDPIRGRQNSNSYGYVFNSAVNWNDPSGLAVLPNASLYPFIPGIDVVGGSISPCWSAAFSVNFTVPPESVVSSGWVVQEIESELQILTCAGTDITTKVDKRYTHFWEAFDIELIRVPGEGGDTFERAGSLWNTRGSYTVRGLAKGAGNVTLPDAFVTGQVPEAGNIPSTYLKPWGWDQLPGTRHDMKVTWDCCCSPPCVLMRTTPQWAIEIPSDHLSGCPLQIAIYDLEW